ncbi:inactive receptor kinase [Musa troglodytarum]|uniref:Inactive receptor kinase n=1 Tax=Musa troglodytarum TaxID=320322 RepID=A0A9E7LAK8_9LILI|nr:inactive receptor kinase [Musa troglodytarum]
MSLNRVLLAISALWLAISSPGVGAGNLAEDKQALLDFLAATPHGRGLNWSRATAVCGLWTGITCSADGSRVVAVRLPGIGFSGPIPPNTLSRLSALRILSLRANILSGPFPADFANLTALTGLHLQLNRFSGPMPSDFSRWNNLTVLDLSFNDFNGSIPASISNLTHLTALNLSNNSFSGQIPDLDLPNLLFLNLSGNHLNGTIPKSIQAFPNSSFSGNDLSPLYPLTPASLPAPTPLPAPSPSRVSSSITMRKLSESAILGIIVGGCAAVCDACVISLSLLLEGERREFCLRKSIKGGPVTGEGTFGTAYKAVLEDATTVVVKRLKEAGVGKKEFEQQMEVVGRIKHENVAELRAYYYSKDEKLMVYDYYTQGSVSSLLHGKRGQDRTPLDWETRLKIVLGAARGIARIHIENNGKLVHGNIKSSNVFLNNQQYGCVTDLGLPSIINPMVPPWTAEVFDVELMRYPNIEEEMVEMLQIAMSCVVRMPDRRPKMPEVVRMIEGMRRFDSGNRPSTEGRSEGSTSTPVQDTQALSTPQGGGEQMRVD